MTDSFAGIWPIELRSSGLPQPGLTLWGTAASGEGDWLLSRLDKILLFPSVDSLLTFIDSGNREHCFAHWPDWASSARDNLADDVAEFDFDEDGVWLTEPPGDWDPSRRSEVSDLLNILWDAANQFDDKASVTELLGGGRGGVLGRLADALMQADEDALTSLRPAEISSTYRSHTHALAARCVWLT